MQADESCNSNLQSSDEGNDGAACYAKVIEKLKNQCLLLYLLKMKTVLGIVRV